MITRRRVLAGTGGLVASAAGGRAAAQEGKATMLIARSGSQPSTKAAAAEYFTGSLRIDQPFRPLPLGRGGRDRAQGVRAIVEISRP